MQSRWAPARRTRAALRRGRKKGELISPHMFQIPIQAAIGGKVIARETVRALRKDVTAKMLRRRHHPQTRASGEAEGEKKMRQFGKVDIPQRAFIAAPKLDSVRTDWPNGICHNAVVETNNDA